MSAADPSPSKARLYRFGPFEVDTARRELRKFGSRIRLERKPWQVLILLLEADGRVVTRSEFQGRLWGDNVFVDFENGLNVAVKKLRAALCDSPDHAAYVETVAGEGYRFVASVDIVVPDAAPALERRSKESKPHILQAVDRAASAPHAADANQCELIVPQAPASTARPWIHARTILIAAVSCVILLSAATLAWRRFHRAPAKTGRVVMVVVLPFRNLSGDAGQEYLSDGMTEELSSQLGNLDAQRVRVIGRTSATAYKNSHSTISQIGKELGVDYAVEGSVRRDGSEIRVVAQLVQVSDQARVWADTYDRDLRDLMQLERKIAADIATEVGASIALAHPGTDAAHVPNADAHESYLLGRYNVNRRTPAGWKTGKEYFEQAIRDAPDYSAAYAGLAECRIPLREAETAALKAVQLDPKSPEALAALGWVELYKVRDLAAAERSLRRAVELDPNYAPARHTYANYLDYVGRLEEAVRQERQAVLLDPLVPIYRAALAEGLAGLGQDEAALQEVHRAFEIQPEFPKGHETLGHIYLRRGRYKDAIREYEASGQHGGEDLSGGVGYACALLGDRKRALKALKNCWLQATRSVPPGSKSPWATPIRLCHFLKKANNTTMTVCLV